MDLRWEKITRFLAKLSTKKLTDISGCNRSKNEKKNSDMWEEERSRTIWLESGSWVDRWG